MTINLKRRDQNDAFAKQFRTSCHIPILQATFTNTSKIIRYKDENCKLVQRNGKREQLVMKITIIYIKIAYTKAFEEIPQILYFCNHQTSFLLEFHCPCCLVVLIYLLDYYVTYQAIN